MTNVKVAIIHDHFLYMGGAERVLLAVLKMYPQADVYMAFAAFQNINVVKKITSGRVFISPFNKISFTAEMADWYKPLLYFWWENLNLSKYDLVISSSHSFSSKSVTTTPGPLHISYIHTPPRYLWNEFSETQWIKTWPLQVILSPLMSWLRVKDVTSAQRPNILMANSKEVQRRIKKYYHRESEVVYPPIKIPPKVQKTYKREYFLIVSRLVRQKGSELVIKATTKLKLPLKVVGVGAQERYLRTISGLNTKFLGNVSDEDLEKIYSKAKALIFCGRDEDFGIAPVEAMAHGVPVIAYASGGVKETVVDGKTGVLFFEYSTEALEEAITRFERLRFSSESIRRYAQQFSEKRFITEFQSIVQENLKENK